VVFQKLKLEGRILSACLQSNRIGFARCTIHFGCSVCVCVGGGAHIFVTPSACRNSAEVNVIGARNCVEVLKNRSAKRASQ